MIGKNWVIATLRLTLLLALPLAAAAQESAAPADAGSTPPADIAQAAPSDAAAPADASAAPADASTPPADASTAASAPEVLDTVPVEELPPTEDVGWLRGVFPGFDFGYSGFVRLENAFSASKNDNPANQLGNVFNGRVVARQAYTPPALGAPTWTSQPAATMGAPAQGNDSSSAGIRGTTTDDTGIIAGRPFEKVDNKFNYQVVRTELESTVRFTPDFAIIARVRGLFDTHPYDEFDAGGLTTQRGITGGDPALYHGSPDYFDYHVDGSKSSNPLEWTGSDYQIYFPTLVADYANGPLNLRVGNQQIAWGQALFFRVFDQVDGLDLRRHLVLDYAQEEFADERVPALGARISWQFNEELLADAFVQKFQPTVFPNPNTQYNVIPVGFTVHDRYAADGYDSKLNYGMRFKGNFGQWGFQAMAIQRYNPDGVFRWTESGVNKSLNVLPGSFGDTANTLYNNKTPYSGTGPCNPTTCRLYGSIGEAMSHTAFEASPGGVYSAPEWFNYAAQVRLDSVDGLNAVINEFPAAFDVYASPVGTDPKSNCVDVTCEAYNELNTFFIAGGGSLRGHIAREYFQEQVYALGASYVTEGEPGGIFDQLIINLEHSLTTNRTFTATSLSRNYPRMSANITALVLEKYYRFTQEFPATYFVFQYMHRDKDDLFGRLLSGYGGTQEHQATGVSGGANYYVLAFQQPFPQDIYRVGFATLYDPRGSILIQPGIRWKITGAWQLDAFHTYIDGAIGNANPNNTLLSTIDFADETTLRLSYQF